MDVLIYTNRWAFDSIAVLAFGSPFGMLANGNDLAEVVYEDGEGGKRVEEVSAIEVINFRGEYSGTMGCVPVWMRGYVKYLPWFAMRLKSVKALTGVSFYFSLSLSILMLFSYFLMIGC